MVDIAGGGEMISDVFLDHSTYADPPSRLVELIYYNIFTTLNFASTIESIEHGSLNMLHLRFIVVMFQI